MELSNEELTILDEALDAWIAKSDAGEMMGELFVAMLSGKDKDETEEEAATRKAKIEAEREVRQKKRDEERAVRKRRATILKAKLYELGAAMETKSAVGKFAEQH